jgi:NAD(P)-dependent dehydrogenase (short-subunit alcohol dehydrogenase family)
MGNFFSNPESKVILITGASAGIGKESALTLIKRGHIVYGAARRVDKMQDLVLAGGHAIGLDVTNEQQVKEAVKRIIKEQGRIDVLVNNAGFDLIGAVEDLSIEDARRQFEVNLFGLASMTKEVLPHMRKVRKGTIVNVSSVAGKIYNPFTAWYVASKHALEGWSDCLRLELSLFNIKVAIIEPGIIRTEIMDVPQRPVPKDSPYATYLPNHSDVTKAVKQQGSHPSVIANIITKASESVNPKRRYVAGAFATPLLFMRSWFGDCFFDFLMKRTAMKKHA